MNDGKNTIGAKALEVVHESMKRREANPMSEPDTSSESEFADWFRKNYPGPDTIIHKPDWHSPKIYRAATHALTAENAALKARVDELEGVLRVFVENDFGADYWTPPMESAAIKARALIAEAQHDTE